MLILSVLVLYGTWSFAFPLGKYMLQFSSPVFLTGFRMTLAGVLLLAYLSFRKQIPRLGNRQLISIVLLAFFSIYLTNVLELWSLHRLSAAKTCFIYSLSPFLTAFLSFIHFKEKMTPLKWLGMLIGVLGFIPAMMVKTGTEDLLGAFWGFTWPELGMLGAVFFSVYGWIILRIVVKNEAISPLMANGGSMLMGGLMALATSLWVDTWAPLPIHPEGVFSVVGTTLLLTLLSNIFCYNLYGYLLRYCTATLMSFFGLLSPFFTALSSWMILKEPPSLSIFISTGIVALGLLMFYKEELRQGYLMSKILK